MPVIVIREAQRENARLVLGLSSISGEGKTFTAIQLGYGLANYNAKKLGLLDLENRRGSLYADILTKATKPTNDRFLIADLYPPFSPARGVEAITEFEKAGVEVLIVDSTTHFWEGTGGCVEIAESNIKMPNWALAKKEHKRFMNKLLQCDMHIIACVRAREKTKPEKVDGKVQFVEYGLQPIQEKNFMFEMTASLMLHDRGMRQDLLKVPDALLGILGRGKGYITADDGKALRDWVDGGLKLDPTVEKYRNRLISNTEGGVAHITECWAKTPPAIQEGLGKGFWETLLESAKGYEAQSKLAAEDQKSTSDTPSTASTEERAEADALAAKAREAAANTPPPAESTPTKKAAEQPKPKEPEKAKEAPKAEAKPAPKADPKPDPKPEPVKETVVKGVLPSDPVF